jgi:hypothetical protein
MARLEVVLVNAGRLSGFIVISTAARGSRFIAAVKTLGGCLEQRHSPLLASATAPECSGGIEDPLLGSETNQPE